MAPTLELRSAHYGWIIVATGALADRTFTAPRAFQGRVLLRRHNCIFRGRPGDRPGLCRADRRVEWNIHRFLSACFPADRNRRRVRRGSSLPARGSGKGMIELSLLENFSSERSSDGHIFYPPEDVKNAFRTAKNNLVPCAAACESDPSHAVRNGHVRKT
jgi:hypothetical protein